jgi:hypothetical protein
MAVQESTRFNVKKALSLAAVILLAMGMVSYGRDASGPTWEKVKLNRGASDFASYFYAVNATVQGENPYDNVVLNRLVLADKDNQRETVHPYFYPPPYLLAMAWALPLDLSEAHRVFYWAGSFFLLAVMLSLWKWLPSWGMFGASGLVLLFYTPIFDTLRMGQANLLVLALLVCGVMLVEFEGANKRRWLGGALVGLACMLKMSPAVLVMWWIARREWRPVIAAILAAIGSSVLVLPLVGFSTQIYFYSDVLPSFTSGNYHGLTVDINIPMNHSLLNFCMQITSGFQGMTPKTEATALATNLARIISLSTLLGLLFVLRKPRPDPVSRANAAGALVVVMVLMPAYTYEHHLVFLIFPLLAVVAALVERRLVWTWWLVLVPVFGLIAWSLPDFKAYSASLGDGRLWSANAVAFRELKFLAVVILGALCTLAALSPSHPRPSSGGSRFLSMPRVIRRSPGEGDWLE